MKILILNYEYPPIGGGAGNQTKLLSEEFIQKGHQVRIITSHFNGLPFYEIQGDLEIYRVPVLRKSKDRSNIFQMFLYLKMAFFPIMWSCWRWKPNIVFSFFLLPTSILAFFQKMIFHIPYVVSLRGGDVPSFVPKEFKTPKILKIIDSIIGNNSEKMVAVSQDLQELAKRDFPKLSHKILNINNGIKIKNFKRINNLKTTFLFVGRLTLQKNLEFIINCLREVHGDYIFKIVGDGILKDHLENLVNTHNLEEKIIFLGWLEKDEVLREMKSAHFLFLLSEIEGLSNSGLEAYSLGLPIIASNSPGVRDFVKNEITGFRVEINEKSQIVNILNRIIENPQISLSFSDNCRNFVFENYNIEKCANEYLSLFEHFI